MNNNLLMNALTILVSVLDIAVIAWLGTIFKKKKAEREAEQKYLQIGLKLSKEEAHDITFLKAKCTVINKIYFPKNITSSFLIISKRKENNFESFDFAVELLNKNYGNFLNKSNIKDSGCSNQSSVHKYFFSKRDFGLEYANIILENLF